MFGSIKHHVTPPPLLSSGVVADIVNRVLEKRTETDDLSLCRVSVRGGAMFYCAIKRGTVMHSGSWLTGVLSDLNVRFAVILNS